MVLSVELTGRDVLVAGGGPAAAGLAGELLEQGAVVTVAAAELCEDLRDLLAAGRVRWHAADATPTDLAGRWLVALATGGGLSDARLAAAAEERRVLTVRAPSAAPLPPARTGPGRVVLVGGGPGAEDLITVRGLRWLERADVVVTDRLGPSTLLRRLPAGVEVVDVGKTPGAHKVSQTEINQVLVDQARLGRTVVRLKGGDPFLFGRGGEEWLACREAGVEVEVVPGVSSALSVPALAGVPVTHRGLATGVLVEHGHGELSGAAVRAVVTGEATLVVLMGMALLGRHVQRLLDAGADPDTPAAVVERGSTPEERSVRAPLAGLVEAVAAGGLAAPAVVVVGAVVRALSPGEENGA
ncbi:uroporphyrinogen-III C-methyltransferase [Auraticoccus monumenti]|uniref:uroporphyrinogen-III C-methyltransferase n=1 Tax=Auraticoccus monumenti TaxID=675864 RepID=A0A1G7DJV0_9ACTN|nr:uroporphyrinogen-III C-methyltransferase [Auraticoccus monumenti]SDE51340.1 uroporphyrin-III C-methyltransferase [Auraticoccus monumenti]